VTTWGVCAPGTRDRSMVEVLTVAVGAPACDVLCGSMAAVCAPHDTFVSLPALLLAPFVVTLAPFSPGHLIHPFHRWVLSHRDCHGLSSVALVIAQFHIHLARGCICLGALVIAQWL
jgi:hypothetical protein